METRKDNAIFLRFIHECKYKTVLPIQYMSQFAWLSLFCYELEFLFHLKVIKWHELHIILCKLKVWKHEKYNKIVHFSFLFFCFFFVFFFLQSRYLEHIPWVVIQKNETIIWIISFQRFKSTEAPLAPDLLLHAPKPALVHVAKLRPVACESRIHKTFNQAQVKTKPFLPV